VSAETPSLDGPKYWDMWPQHYDYVYLLFTESDADNPDPAHLTLLQDGTNFQLYRINGQKDAATGPVSLSVHDAKAIAR